MCTILFLRVTIVILLFLKLNRKACIFMIQIKKRGYFKINFNIFIPSSTVFQNNESAHFHCPKCSLKKSIKWKADLGFLTSENMLQKLHFKTCVIAWDVYFLGIILRWFKGKIHISVIAYDLRVIRSGKMA